MKIAFDPNYNEPAPQKHFGIFCVLCKKKLASKAQAVSHHKGHDVRYLNQDGTLRE